MSTLTTHVVHPEPAAVSGGAVNSPTARAAAPVTAARPARRLSSAHTLVSVSAALVGVLSYAATVIMAHLLPAQDYAAYAAVVSLLTTLGIAAGALVPLPLAAALRASAPGSVARRGAAAFALAVSVMAGGLAAVVVAAIAATFTEVGVAAMAGLAAFAVFVITPAQGSLQGQQRFGAYAVAALAQVGVRIAAGALAVLLGWGAGGALLGFVVGTLVVIAVGIRGIQADLPLSLSRLSPRVLAERARWVETGPIAAAQLTLSTLAGLDVVLAAVLSSSGNATAVAGYQAMSALTKAPLYVAAGAVLVSYPLLRTATGPARDRALRATVQSFLRLALPAAVILATVPADVSAWVLPSALAGAAAQLPWLALAGFGFATLTVTHLVLLGLGATRQCLTTLLPTAVVVPASLLCGWSLAGVHGLAAGAAVGSAACAALAVGAAAPLLPRCRVRTALGALALCAVGFAALAVARSWPLVWCVGVGLLVTLVLRRATRRVGHHSTAAVAEEALAAARHGRLRVLHLGFEDPAMPGSGGGSLRTHEINRRLAGCHDITVLTTRFPGCRDRVQDGVRYVHVGVGAGRTRLTRLLGYIAVLPVQTRRRGADLVVEDFFAPFSTMAAPLWSGRPTVAVVQWLNAAEKSRQYHLPLHRIERAGVRRHHGMIAMSGDLAERLRSLNPTAQVEVIGNGVDQAAFETSPRVGGDVVYIGRLEIAQKGLDLLLQAWAMACPHQPGMLLIAGTGPDQGRLESLAAELGIADRVRFLGWMSGAAKYDLLAGARLVAVPSRFETFGIAAVEALATGTPVLAFDIDCLREVVPNSCGVRVPPFDLAGYAAAINRLCADPRWLRAAGEAGRAFAARFDWDHLAAAQDRMYRRTVTEHLSAQRSHARSSS